LKTHHKINHIVRAVWVIAILSAFYLYFFQRSFIEAEISLIAEIPLYTRYFIYTLLGSLRGFTLIPVTYLIVLGLLFLPLMPLYLLTMVGIVASSFTVYYFSEFIHLGEYFEEKYPTQIAKLKSVVEKNELPIVISWSMLPFVPTDVMCYVCGSLEVNVKKFLLGIIIGEGITCAIYIFLGKDLLVLLHSFI